MNLKAERLLNRSPMQPLQGIEKEILLWNLRDAILEMTNTDSLEPQLEVDLALLASEVDSWPRVARLIAAMLETIMEKKEE